MKAIAGGGFIVILIAAAIVLYLNAERTETAFNAVTQLAVDLREEGVEGAAMDRQAAERIVDTLTELISQPEAIPQHTEDLRAIATTAAAWAAAAATPSQELTAAVALRGAADELRAHATGSSPRHLNEAQRLLDKAKDALSGQAAPAAATDAIRDRIQNLDRSRKEQYQDMAEEMQGKTGS